MSYQVIARKWRPQTFRDLVGQQHVTETLKNAILNNRVAHAYIFSGARGVGKTTAARILAKALNCVKGPTPEPCGVCDSCREIAAGTSLDVIEIDAASNRGIDQIRELREMVRYVPAASRTKVVILDEAHMLTGEASNALLKTLEEPPDRVVFVMATTEPENLEDTIRSRSQHFHFRALTFAEITKRLDEIAQKEELKIEPGAMAVIARMAEGSLRDALSLLEQARAYCGDIIPDDQVRALLGVVPEDALEELVGAVAAGSADRALGLVHTFQKEGRNLQHFCREAIRHMRNLLIARVCGADSELIAATPDQRPAIAKAAALFSEEDLTRFFQILLQTDDDLRRKPDPRVHLEMGLLRLINASRLAPLEELLAELKSGAPGGTSSGTARAASSTLRQTAPPPKVLTQTFAPAASAHPEASQRFASPSEAGDATTATTPGVKAPNDSKETIRVSGISHEQVAEIKSAIQAEQKFLGELVEHSSGWELEGAELRIYFSPEKRPFAEMIEGREPLERIRAVSSNVLGRAVRVCARLDSVAAAAAASGSQELRAQFERDPLVRSMLERFGGKITEVRSRQQEK
ncbi:MAG: DNA polymerase III subunit gamma/tau [Acidobacteria bacterium]|nr:MAG: DNA polymerase III, subunit gamma and tau [Acidobacteria bacterium 13_2_20CM_58_27]PYT89353.1 MAG: DNA polymerase III subunit gamma/tau [Acidobacteriota bacterium]